MKEDNQNFNPNEDLTVTKANAKVEELEKELARLQEAKASKEAEQIKREAVKASEEVSKTDIKAEVTGVEAEATSPETEAANPEATVNLEANEPGKRRVKTNAEAYAASEKNVADMLAEYDAITADDDRKAIRREKAIKRQRKTEAHAKRPVESHAKKTAEAQTKRPVDRPVEAHAKKPVEAHAKKPVETYAKRPAEAHSKKTAEKPAKTRAKKASSKKGSFLSNLTGMDYVIGLTGVLVLIAAVVTFSIYSSVKTTEAQIAAFVPVGENMAEIGIAGESALLAMANNREEETIVIEEEYTVAEYDEKDDETSGNISVNMKLQTVVKDLKIKFVNSKNGKLVPGVPFQVEITDSAKKTITKMDDDKDGIIYIKSIAPGEAKVKMTALTGYDAYSLPKDVQTINIKETLDYKKIDVADEVKTEAQVNAKAEDTAKANVTESELQDTVEWVESTKTPVSGASSSEAVSRDKLDEVPKELRDKVASLDLVPSFVLEKIKSASDMWNMKIYASETQAETESPQTETPETEAPSTEAPSSETPSQPESSEAQPSSEATDNSSQIDLNKALTYGGKQVYLDKECTIKATYRNYDEQSEFFVITGEATEYKYTGWQTLDGVTYFFNKDGVKITGDQVIQGAKYSFGDDGALKNGSGVLGIDVSKWNGSIDWSQVKNSGISYVIIRCGYRGSTTGALIEDPTFRTNIKGAQAAGLKVGVYFFTQATTEVEAVEEASMTLSLISGYKMSYPVFLDVESSGGRGDKIDAATRTKVINAYCQTIKNSGYSAGVYANRTWLNEKFSPGSLGGCKIWLAQYAATPTYGGSYQMWQYSSKGSVKGIKGNVDMNLSYLNY